MTHNRFTELKKETMYVQHVLFWRLSHMGQDAVGFFYQIPHDSTVFSQPRYYTHTHTHSLILVSLNMSCFVKSSFFFTIAHLSLQSLQFQTNMGQQRAKAGPDIFEAGVRWLNLLSKLRALKSWWKTHHIHVALHVLSADCLSYKHSSEAELLWRKR